VTPYAALLDAPAHDSAGGSMKITHGFEQISSCPDCRISAADLFDAGLSERAKADFARSLESRSYAPGDSLFAEGSEPQGVFLIDSGRVKLVRRADARPQVVKIARAGDVLGLSATLTKSLHRVTGEVLEETKARFLSALEFHRFLKRRTMFIGHVVKYLEDHVHEHEEPLVLTGAERKVAAYLVQKASDDGHQTNEGKAIDFPITLGELSSILYVRAERLQDAFDRFEDHHWLYRGHRSVTLLDEAALREVSRVADSH
jgi:CRP/FNR family transcriptional regulator, cyclic AMP receptor protein